MSGFSDSNGVAGGRDEPTQNEINQYMQSLSATSARMEGAALPAPAPDGEYVASGTKYSGPLAVFKYEGGHKVHPETGNRMMHTAAGEVATVYYAGGAHYIGELKEDMLHGHGLFTDPEGNTYEGDWYEDQRQGRAKFTCAAGVYEGEYFQNKRHGDGKEVDSAGNEFKGQFENGDPKKGTLTYANGDIYRGELSKDWSRHGWGTFLDEETGTKLTGEWNDDDFVGNT